MDTKTKDADTEWNEETITGPHGLLTLVESFTGSRTMYIPYFRAFSCMLV